MYYILAIGLIGLGIVGMYVSIFKYTKEQYKSVKFTGTGQGLDGAIFAAMMNVLPWWMVKTVLIFSSMVAVFIGVMTLYGTFYRLIENILFSVRGGIVSSLLETSQLFVPQWLFL